MQIGALIADAARAKVERLVADARDRGASLRIGGHPVPELGSRFFAPTVLEGVDPSMALSCEEIFGPVIALQRFATEAEAIARANDTPYGLAAYFYAQGQARTWRVAEALEYGMVGANEALISK